MSVEYPVVATDDFARRFTHRGASLMWFLGAGASAAAGVPTANDLVWYFKQQLYVSQRRVSLERVADLSNPAVRKRLQEHIDSIGTLPPAGAASEYAALFEASFSSEVDRRALLDAKLSGASPSYGHLALATLMRGDLIRIVWTTNFDSLVADACALIFGSTARLSSIALDAPSQLGDLLAAERWPIEVKLHGDFRSRQLKNTSDELRHQDAKLRSELIQLASRFGLVVVGYSGRDTSIMDAMTEAVRVPGAFPGGLFWLHRDVDEPQAAVSRLLLRAAENGIDAGIVRIENFDEALRDLVRLLPNLTTDELDAFGEQRKRWSPPPRPVGKGGWPIVRFNALPVVAWPKTCRRIVCDLGGWKDVRAAFHAASVDVPFARVRAGVLAFGSDQDIQKALTPHSVTEVDIYDIQERKLQRDVSGERSLLSDALMRALGRTLGLDVVARRLGSWLLAPTYPNDHRWKPLSKIVGPIEGNLPGDPKLRWREGVSLRLDWAGSQLWLLFDAVTVFDHVPADCRPVASGFARERSVKRYNRQLNQIMDFWSALIGVNDDLSTFQAVEGINATFRVGGRTGFSRRTVQ